MERNCRLTSSLLAFAVLVLAVALAGCPGRSSDTDSDAVAPGAHGLPAPDSDPSGGSAQPGAAGLTSDAAESSEPPTATPPEAEDTAHAASAPPEQAAADCHVNMRRMASALHMYVADYDDRYPPVGKWCDVLSPYMPDRSIDSCPANPSEYSYAINLNLDGRRSAGLQGWFTTVTFFESSAGRPNAADAGDTLCDPPRHAEGNNYAYADGHVAPALGPQSFTVEVESP